MSTRPSKHLTRRSAASALDRVGTSGSPAVDRILTAATAPGTPFELNREADTLAVFRRSGLTPVPVVQRTTTFQALRARVASANILVAAGAAAVLAGGGFAFAASSGHLPDVLGGSHHRSPTGAAHSSQAPGHATATSTPSAKPTTPRGTPTPNYKGLCRAFQAKSAINPGKALANPAFTALATKAGGKDQMTAYCVSLVGAPGSNPTHGPTVRPTTPPTEGPTAHPTPTHPVHPTPTHPVHSHSAAHTAG